MAKRKIKKKRTRARDFHDKRKYSRLDSKSYRRDEPWERNYRKHRKKILRRARQKRRMNRGLVGFRGMFG